MRELRVYIEPTIEARNKLENCNTSNCLLFIALRAALFKGCISFAGSASPFNVDDKQTNYMHAKPSTSQQGWHEILQANAYFLLRKPTFVSVAPTPNRPDLRQQWSSAKIICVFSCLLRIQSVIGCGCI